jgi:hypothetical protein
VSDFIAEVEQKVIDRVVGSSTAAAWIEDAEEALKLLACE